MDIARVTPLGVLTLFAAAALVACNPTGTCMHKSKNELGDQCVINMNKKGCESAGGEFIEETSAQALLRCKSDGYDAVGEQPGAVAQKLKEDKIVILYKK